MASIEIERKFILKKLPEFVESVPVSYERYYLYVGGGIELRIQKKDEKYELERKEATSNLGRTSEIWKISEGEFMKLKELGGGSIQRENYDLEDQNYDLSIKVYHGKFEGLIRAEVEFESEEEAAQFVPYDWMGAEITDSDLGRDSKLAELDPDGFRKLINDILN